MKVSKMFKGTYKFIGVNFTVIFDNDLGYWFVDFHAEGNVNADFLTAKGFENTQYTTKKELVHVLSLIDSNEQSKL